MIWKQERSTIERETYALDIKKRRKKEKKQLEKRNRENKKKNFGKRKIHQALK